ncbi:MAG TPA: glucokinase [Candidatus Limnocylindria bacterium]|nr:glucokinase [Candidatus Limnocylindria bacterium]
MILAGDLGGTKSNLGLFDVQQGKLAGVAKKRYATQQHSGLDEMVRDFLHETGGKVTASCFGIAGPVVENKVRGTNMPWEVDGAFMARLLDLKRVRLLNDLEAAAYGISVMEPKDLETLHTGIATLEANRAVIAAGTGLGEGVLFWDGKQHLPMATEAGHADFAPNTKRQGDLWQFLKTRNEFVTSETILSGGGFQRVHEFVDGSVRHPGFDDGNVDPAPEITRMGLSGECPVCVETLNLWVDVYGAEAGNLALRTVARGGVFITGGIAVKILPKMRNGRFATAFQHKEKLGEFLARIPIQVVLNEDCPLLGAAFVAWKRL